MFCSVFIVYYNKDVFLVYTIRGHGTYATPSYGYDFLLFVRYNLKYFYCAFDFCLHSLLVNVHAHE